MSKTRAQLKMQAKERLQGNWAYAVGLYALPALTISAIVWGCVLIVFVLVASLAVAIDEEVAALIGAPLFILISLAMFVGSLTVIIGITLGFLDFFRGKRPTYTEAGTYLLKEGRFGKFFPTNLVMIIFIYLWSLLLVIPGIIKTYSYSMTNYILKDKLEKGESMTVTQAITESRQLMMGHKWEYFVLNLSFIGWAILANLTAGIGYLWLIPYIQTTTAAFYQNLIDNSAKDQINPALPAN
ncbi:DUF975 family protein [Streptococcus caviae]|uniref:DUF975 family protein n=1 Tax=Streptococcus sp. 'caviae' TaxID=1915004 RepID=UPI00094B7BB0|nr:DUF975 family protein [Streptococcus sp. 'caviae']OLN84025.1 hypothetical protein BMI76_02170 [Streptococcus sp. 'caviae']